MKNEFAMAQGAEGRLARMHPAPAAEPEFRVRLVSSEAGRMLSVGDMAAGMARRREQG